MKLGAQFVEKSYSTSSIYNSFLFDVFDLTKVFITMYFISTLIF